MVVKITNNIIQCYGGGSGTMGAIVISITAETTQELDIHQNIVSNGNTIHSSRKHFPAMKCESIKGLSLSKNELPGKINIRKCGLKWKLLN